MRKVIGIDVDGTLAPESGDPSFIAPPYSTTKRLLAILKATGYVVCIWSCRPTYMIKRWLCENSLDKFVYYVNESPLPADDRKLLFHVYIGNDALRYCGEDHIPDLLAELRSRYYPDYGARDTEFCDQTPHLMLRGTGHRFLQEFSEHWKTLWEFSHKKICLLTICSHAKPYSKSYIHLSIRKALYEAGLLEPFLQYAHISNAGIVPTEAGLDYPYNSYDWDNSTAGETVVTALRKKMTDDLSEWYKLFGIHYSKIVVYLRAPGNTSEAASIALNGKASFVFVKKEDLPYAFPSDPDDCLTIERNLENLTKTIKQL
jgi:hypothetical protein